MEQNLWSIQKVMPYPLDQNDAVLLKEEMQTIIYRILQMDYRSKKTSSNDNINS